MTNLIVASFKDENNAIEAMHKLTELENYGDISIYGNAMVRSREDGNHEILQENNSEGWRTLAGMGIGSLIGMFGGPVGLVVGLTTGSAIGMIADVGRQSFNESFVKKIEDRMPPNSVSIIAEIDEDSEVFIDNALKPFGAEIYRSDIDYEFDNYVMDRIDDIDKDITETREKLKTSVGKEKEKLSKKIKELKDKRNAFIENARNDAKKLNDKIKGDIRKRRIEIVDNKIYRYEQKLQSLVDELKALKLDNEKITNTD